MQRINKEAECYERDLKLYLFAKTEFIPLLRIDILTRILSVVRELCDKHLNVEGALCQNIIRFICVESYVRVG